MLAGEVGEGLSVWAGPEGSSIALFCVKLECGSAQKACRERGQGVLEIMVGAKAFRLEQQI